MVSEYRNLEPEKKNHQNLCRKPDHICKYQIDLLPPLYLKTGRITFTARIYCHQNIQLLHLLFAPPRDVLKSPP